MNLNQHVLSHISRKSDVCVPIRKCFSEGDRYSPEEPVLLYDYPNRSDSSLAISMIQWELFSYSTEELLDILFYGSIRLNFLNCYFDYPLLNQRPKEVVAHSALGQILEGADLVEELNKNMSNKWGQIGTVNSVTGCQVFPSVPVLIPAKTFCQFQLITEKTISLEYSLKVAVNLHGIHQSTINIG